MNLVADESVDTPIVERLRTDGHTVAYVAEMSSSFTDDGVLEGANADQCPLMSGDKDFGELVFRLRRVTHGVILVRLPGLSLPLKASIVSEAVGTHGNEMLYAFTVISPYVVRIRRNLN